MPRLVSGPAAALVRPSSVIPKISVYDNRGAPTDSHFVCRAQKTTPDVSRISCLFFREGRGPSSAATPSCYPLQTSDEAFPVPKTRPWRNRCAHSASANKPCFIMGLGANCQHLGSPLEKGSFHTPWFAVHAVACLPQATQKLPLLWAPSGRPGGRAPICGPLGTEERDGACSARKVVGRQSHDELTFY